MGGGVAAGLEQPADGSLRLLWLGRLGRPGPDAERLLTDEELAVMFCRMFALPAGTDGP